jgi:hypothetical protein
VNLQGLRWPVVLAALAVTVGVLFGAGSAVKSRKVDEPLTQLYGGSPLVESYALERRAGEYRIKLRLKETPDLAQAYHTLDEETGKILSDVPYRIQVEDRRSPKLEQTFGRVNLYVQEALVTGQFAAMADKVEQEAARAGLSARVAVDEERVFVQIHDRGDYLYSVVSRTQTEPKPLRKEGGTRL